MAEFSLEVYSIYIPGKPDDDDCDRKEKTDGLS